MKSYMLCNYCDHKWEKGYVNKYCPKCHDSNIKAIHHTKSNINYYEGSPDFVDNTKKIQKEDYSDYL